MYFEVLVCLHVYMYVGGCLRMPSFGSEEAAKLPIPMRMNELCNIKGAQVTDTYGHVTWMCVQSC
jgi:hypothetical protein